MSIEITRKGLIELIGPDGVRVSRHTQIEEAIESANRDAEEKDYADATYRIVYPEREMRIIRVPVIVPDRDLVAPPQPAAPTIHSYHVWETSIRITFPAPVAEDHASYSVYRSTDDVTYTLIQAGITAATATFSGLTQNTQYYWKITATDDSNNESERSDATAVTTLSIPGAPLQPPAPTPGEQGTWNYMPDSTYRTGEDIVNGWDFSVPDYFAVEPHSGQWHYDDWEGSNDAFAGQRLYQYDLNWNDVEPTEGNFDWSGVWSTFASVMSQTNSAGNPLYGGIFVQVRGLAQYSPDTWRNTAPDWLWNEGNVEGPFAGGGGNNISHLDMTNSRNQAATIAFLKECAEQLTPRDDVVFILTHGISNTLGEEWGGVPQTGLESVRQWWVDGYLAAWIDNTLPQHRWKINHVTAYVGGTENDFRYRDYMWANGAGIRPSGSIEYWLAGASWYLRGDTGGYATNWQTMSGQKLTDPIGERFYILTDQNHPQWTNKIQFQEQNEADRVWPFNVGDGSYYKKFHHFMGHMRGLQMMFNAMWEVNKSPFNKQFVRWTGTQWGHVPATANSAWILLQYTWGNLPSATYGWSSSPTPGEDDKKIYNFERWIYQREAFRASGAESEDGATGGGSGDPCRQNHEDFSLWPTQGTDSFTAGGNIRNDDNRNTVFGRRGASLGFAVDPQFIDGSENVVIKVTYYDNNSGSFTLRYNGTTERSAICAGDNMVRTATFNCNGFTATQTQQETDPADYSPNFYIESTADNPILFIQIMRQSTTRQGLTFEEDFNNGFSEHNGNIWIAANNKGVNNNDYDTFNDGEDWGPGSNHMTRWESNYTVNGSTITPRRPDGTYFMIQEMQRSQDYWNINGYADGSSNGFNSPRSHMSALQNPGDYKWIPDCEDEVWFGWSMFIPLNHGVENGPAENTQRTNEHWYLTHSPGEYHILISEKTWGDYASKPGGNPDDEYTYHLRYAANGEEGGSWLTTDSTLVKGVRTDNGMTQRFNTESTDVSPYWIRDWDYASDRGVWTDWVVRYKSNPFTNQTTQTGSEFTFAVPGTYPGGGGVLEIWKSLGASRIMTKVFSLTGAPVGLPPSNRAGGVSLSVRQYKFGWKYNSSGSPLPSTIDPDSNGDPLVSIGKDEIRWGFSSDGCGYQDVHPMQENQP